jgi:hypothetical protein
MVMAITTMVMTMATMVLAMATMVMTMATVVMATVVTMATTMMMAMTMATVVMTMATIVMTMAVMTMAAAAMATVVMGKDGDDDKGRTLLMTMPIMATPTRESSGSGGGNTGLAPESLPSNSWPVLMNTAKSR